MLMRFFQVPHYLFTNFKIYYYGHCNKEKAVPLELLSKEFLSQFKTESDVSRFLKDLHTQVLEQMLEDEMDAHLGYEKHSALVIIAIILATAVFSKEDSD